jgi:hypothetical protein
MIVGIVMWQLGIFNMGGTTVTATGFAKIKPQLAGSGVSRAGVFHGVFTNGVGTGITVTTTGMSITVTVGATPTACSAPADILGAGAAGNVAQTQIPAGDNFIISTDGCTPANTAGGAVYNAQITIPYTVAIGGVTTSHTEAGTLRGPAE